MTPPTQGTPPERPANTRLRTLTAALVAAVGGVALLVATRTPTTAPSDPGTTPAVDPCPAGQIIVLRAADTSRVAVVGDTLFVVPGDTTQGSRLVLDSLSQVAGVSLDSGATVPLAAVCAPVSPTYRARLVPTLPHVAPVVAQLAYAILAGHGRTMVPP